MRGKNTPVFSIGISRGCYEDSMRHALASLVIALFLFPSIAFGETMDDLVKRDGIYYKKFTDVPFTGKVKGKTQGSLKNGKRYGAWVRYYGNGQLQWKGTYKDGKEDGVWVRYMSNGQLYMKRTYKNGKRDGPLVIYHTDKGQLASKGTYKDDKKHGPWVYYNMDGTVIEGFTGTYKNGVKVK